MLFVLALFSGDSLTADDDCGISWVTCRDTTDGVPKPLNSPSGCSSGTVRARAVAKLHLPRSTCARVCLVQLRPPRTPAAPTGSERAHPTRATANTESVPSGCRCCKGTVAPGLAICRRSLAHRHQKPGSSFARPSGRPNGDSPMSANGQRLLPEDQTSKRARAARCESLRT